MMAMAGAAHGGAEVFFERLAIAFANRKIHLKVVIRRNPERAERLAKAEITPLQLPFGGPFDRATRREFAKAVATYSPHVCLSFMSRAAKFAPQGVAGERLNIARLGGYYDAKYYRASDHLIGNTEDICRHLVAAGFLKTAVHYLPNFVDEGTIPPAQRSAYDTPEAAPLIVAMGRLHRNKAFDVLLESVAQLPGVHLWLAGSGELETELKALCNRLGLGDRVRFLGWIEDTRPLIEAADIVAVPSRHEPLGNVILEAWAHNKPVVAVASEGPAQLIEDGVTGVLSPVDDEVLFGQALRRLMDDANLATEIAAAGHAGYTQNFSEAVVVENYLSLFRRLCADAGIDLGK
jgi:glycosyltransferase involved in cell wall biosynthesis